MLSRLLDESSLREHDDGYPAYSSGIMFVGLSLLAMLRGILLL